MNKKRILSYVLTIGIVLGGSNFAYASETLDESTKAAVESTVLDSEKNKAISDEEALDIAAKAMKYYLNRDVDSFVGTEITRHNYKTPNTVWVHYKTADEINSGYIDNAVAMDAYTGEVLRAAREGRKGIFKGEVNKEKIKESIINVLAKADLKADEDTNWDSIFVCHDGGDANMYLNVNGGKPVEVVIDLDDFSVVSFYKLYVMYPGEDFGIK